jgi:ferredoxin-NADP reductase
VLGEAIDDRRTTMTMHDVELVGRETVADATMAFHFTKPAAFRFKPGQAIDVLLGEPAAGDDARHTFSIVSAPFEERLTIATRLRDSAFKRALRDLRAGARLRIEGPSGSLTLHNDAARGALFIAGGIGITPFVSMLRHAAHERLPHRLALLYANHRPEDAAFLEELETLARTHDRFRLLATMTQMHRSQRRWGGETARIGEPLLRAAARGLARPIHYVAGSPAMVESIRATLNAAGIDDDDIRSEDFYGY